MPESIDWDFIASLEGKRVLKGYVPLPETSKSGVTIATGFDLGQHNEWDLEGLKLSADLTKKLKPYLLLKKSAAVEFLKKNPLTITSEEAIEIDTALKKKLVPQLKNRYLNSTYNKEKVSFDDLPAQAQTVIASVSFQYGDLNTARKPFWEAVSTQNWTEAVKILRGYTDYKPRRKKEADLLEQLVKNEKKVAEVLSSIAAWKAIAAFLIFFGATADGAAAQTLIFDKNLAVAYKNYDRVMSEKKTALEFESDIKVESCAEYLAAKKASTVAENFADRLYLSEYVVCDALAILKQAAAAKRLDNKPTAVNYGKEIYNRLDIGNLPASIADSADRQPQILKNRLAGMRPKVTKYKVEADTKQQFFSVQTIAVADVNGNGKPDWILRTIDEGREGNYRNYAIWLILDAEKSGVLKAEAR